MRSGEVLHEVSDMLRGEVERVMKRCLLLVIILRLPLHTEETDKGANGTSLNDCGEHHNDDGRCHIKLLLLENKRIDRSDETVADSSSEATISHDELIPPADSVLSELGEEVCDVGKCEDD